MNKKVKTFFYVLIESLIPQRKFYGHLIRTRLRFSLKYFFTLIFFLNLIAWSVIIIRLEPWQIPEIKKSLNASLYQFPSDLKITIRNGLLTTNYNHPYFLWLDYRNKKILLSVVDESATPDKISEFKSYFLLTKLNLVTKLPKITNYYWKDMNFGKLEINKNFVFDLISEINNFQILPYFLFISFLLFFVFPVFAFVFELLYIILIAWMFAAVGYFLISAYRRIPPKKIIQLALHASSLPLIISFLLFIFYPTFKLNLWFPIVLVLFLFVALYEAYFDEEETAHHHTHSHHTQHIQHKS